MKRIITNLAKAFLPHSFRLGLRKLNWKRKYYTQILLNKYDKNVYCPIEEREFRCFVTKQESIWETHMTVTNGAKDRHRLVWLYLKNKTNLFKQPSSLVHIAPEYCYLEKLKNIATIQYLPGDKMVKGYGKQEGIAYMDLLKLDIADNAIDYVLCNHVLEHIPDDITAMKEMFRVLKRQGSAIITVPIDESRDKTYEDFSITSPAAREKHFGQWDHVRWYALDIKERLESVGFDAKVVRYGAEFSPEDYKRYGLCDDPIIVATKPL